MPATQGAPHRPTGATRRAASPVGHAKRYRRALIGAVVAVALWACVAVALRMVPEVASAGRTQAASRLADEAESVSRHQHDRSLSAESLERAGLSRPRRSPLADAVPGVGGE